MIVRSEESDISHSVLSDGVSYNIAEVIHTNIILILVEAENAYQEEDFCFLEAHLQDALILRYGKFSIFYIPN